MEKLIRKYIIRALIISEESEGLLKWIKFDMTHNDSIPTEICEDEYTWELVRREIHKMIDLLREEWLAQANRSFDRAEKLHKPAPAFLFIFTYCIFG